MGLIGAFLLVVFCVSVMYFLLRILRHFMLILAVGLGLLLAVSLLAGGIILSDPDIAIADINDVLFDVADEFMNLWIEVMTLRAVRIRSSYNPDTTTFADWLIEQLDNIPKFENLVKVSKQETPVETLYKDILDTNELPSERVLKEANETQKKERERLQKEIEETQRRIEDIGKTAQMESEKANAKAVREMLKPKVDDETIARIAAQVAREMRAAETESKTQKTA